VEFVSSAICPISIMKTSVGSASNTTNKAQLLASLDSVPSCLIVVDKEAKIVSVNREAARLLGGRPDHYPGQSCGDVLQCDSSQETEDGCGSVAHCRTCTILSSIKEAAKGRNVLQQEYELWVGTGDARREVRLLVAAAPFDLGGNRLVLLSLEDVTEQVRLRHQS
jgi:PAS domain-containing protein